jgi:tetratricopeptide (TPR) repeat protein
MSLCIETDRHQEGDHPTAPHAETRPDRLLAEAMTQHRSGRLAEAEAAYQAALQVSPGHAGTLHNLGVIAAARGKLASAVDYFDRAIAAEPYYGAAWYNRAVAHRALGKTSDAIRGFGRACAIDPGHYDAHLALGFLWLAEGERDRALDHFARTYELRRGEDRTGIAAKSLSYANAGKLLHDAEQFRHLAARRRDGRRFELLARSYEEVAKEVGADAIELSDRQFELLGDDYNTAIHISPAPERTDRAVSDRPDRAAIVQDFAACGAVSIDDLLAPAALNGLKRFLLESTVWHDFSHIGGFVASYLEDGLASPLLLQIADELRTTFPEILRSHPLSQAWAFKGLVTESAVDAHADDAAVSVNFWVTPDAANLTPGSGGLVVCRVPPPADWVLNDYDSDKAEVATFLAQHADDTLHVPYRENRAVLFRSRLFHRSDAPHFAPGYENHRINVTMLFGSETGNQ